jgi:hypothetical protein
VIVLKTFYNTKFDEEVKDSSCATPDDVQLYRSAGIFIDDGNILNLWIPAHLQSELGLCSVRKRLRKMVYGQLKILQFSVLLL